MRTWRGRGSRGRGEDIPFGTPQTSPPSPRTCCQFRARLRSFRSTHRGIEQLARTSDAHGAEAEHALSETREWIRVVPRRVVVDGAWCQPCHLPPISRWHLDSRCGSRSRHDRMRSSTSTAATRALIRACSASDHQMATCVSSTLHLASVPEPNRSEKRSDSPHIEQRQMAVEAVHALAHAVLVANLLSDDGCRLARGRGEGNFNRLHEPVDCELRVRDGRGTRRGVMYGVSPEPGVRWVHHPLAQLTIDPRRTAQ